jgi:DNA anti-recombination protein RmuC
VKDDIIVMETKTNAGQGELKQEITEELHDMCHPVKSEFEERMTCTLRHTVKERHDTGRTAGPGTSE